MGKELLIPDGRFETEIVVKNSRFIAYGIPAGTIEEARHLIHAAREEHPGSSHVVHAFLVGGGKRELAGMSDDGEPKGTAARPVMDVLKGSGIVDLLIIVVRYFGGTKLGTGGLVKAYGDCARSVIDGIAVRRLVELVDFSVDLPYNLFREVREAVLEAGGEILSEEFGDLVKIKGSIPADGFEACDKAIIEISRGSLSLRQGKRG